MMVSVVKALESGLSPREGFFLKSTKDLRSEEKMIFENFASLPSRHPGPTWSALFGSRVWGYSSKIFGDWVLLLAVPRSFLRKERKGIPLYGADKRKELSDILPDGVI